MSVYQRRAAVLALAIFVTSIGTLNLLHEWATSQAPIPMAFQFGVMILALAVAFAAGRIER